MHKQLCWKMLRERNIISSQLSPDFTFSSQFYNNWIDLSLNRFLEAFTFSSQICNKSDFCSIVIRMSPKCNLAKNKDPIFVTMFNLKIAWKDIFLTLWWKWHDNVFGPKKIFITFISHFYDKVTITQIIKYHWYG